MTILEVIRDFLRPLKGNALNPINSDFAFLCPPFFYHHWQPRFGKKADNDLLHGTIWNDYINLTHGMPPLFLVLNELCYLLLFNNNLP
jgi:hypothetical protein